MQQKMVSQYKYEKQLLVSKYLDFLMYQKIYYSLKKEACLGLLIVLCLLGSIPVSAEQSIDKNSEISNELGKMLASKQHPYLGRADFTNRSHDLDALYQLANYQLLWLGSDKTEKNINDLIGILSNVSQQGLAPEHYDVDILKSKLFSIRSLNEISPTELVQLDTALSLSLLRFLHDLHYGRVNPQGINFNLKPREKKLIDLPLLIKSNLDQTSIIQLPSLVEPKLKQYQQLKSALASYQGLAESSVTMHLPFIEPVKPEGILSQARELKHYLVQIGDLSTIENDKGLVTDRYSGQLVTAIKKFQYRHGLTADGVIGKSTVVELNTPIAQRIKQIGLAMERLRWLPEFSSSPSIIVNIPAFQLWAFDNINAPKPKITNMRVVVGKALKNQTPVLMAEMSYIDFMPYWNVPYQIVKDEIIPKLLKNPSFLNHENMELVSSSGVTAFSESTIAQLKQGELRIRQRPGKKNALGRVKFLFPNKNDVYLHDTPANSLFSRARRDFSHGCVRVEEPQKLVEFVLKDQGRWDKDAIALAMKSEKMQRVMLKKNVPVLFFYVTAFFDQNDQLIFYPDIYDQDAILLEALKKPSDIADEDLFIKINVQDVDVDKIEDK